MPIVRCEKILSSKGADHSSEHQFPRASADVSHHRRERTCNSITQKARKDRAPVMIGGTRPNG